MKLVKRIFAVVGLVVLLYVLFNIKQDIPVAVLKQKYAHPESKYIDADGLTVHYRDEGNVLDSTPLVLIHGTSSSLHTWDACVEKWKSTHRVIRFDIPGFGLTGPNADNVYTFERYVEFVDTMLKKLNVKKCIVVGNSLGGAIAWNYAYAYPHKVAQLILLDASGYQFTPGKGGLGFKLIKTLGNIPVLKQSLYYVTPNSVLKRSVEGVYHDKNKITEKTIERYKDFMLREGNRKALVERLTTKVIDGTPKIKTIKHPTLIIWGDDDQLIPVTYAYRFKQDIKNSELVIIKNSGHIPMEESPEEVAVIIEKFLAN